MHSAIDQIRVHLTKCATFDQMRAHLAICSNAARLVNWSDALHEMPCTFDQMCSLIKCALQIHLISVSII